MNKDFNFIVKVTTSCPGNCKCCKNRQENFKYKNEKNLFFDIEVFRKICSNIKKWEERIFVYLAENQQ